MSLAQALQQMLKAGLIALRAPLRNPNTSAPTYHPNERCAYHSESSGHDTNNCWALKNKVQDMIDAKEIQFEAPETPNIITAPLPNHRRLLFYLNFRVVFFLAYSNNYCHIKLFYFIKASHMSVLNQYIRIHYIRTAFIFCDVQLSIKKKKF